MMTWVFERTVKSPHSMKRKNNLSEQGQKANEIGTLTSRRRMVPGAHSRVAASIDAPTHSGKNLTCGTKKDVCMCGPCQQEAVASIHPCQIEKLKRSVFKREGMHTAPLNCPTTRVGKCSCKTCTQGSRVKLARE